MTSGWLNQSLLTSHILKMHEPIEDASSISYKALPKYSTDSLRQWNFTAPHARICEENRYNKAIQY